MNQVKIKMIFISIKQCLFLKQDHLLTKSSKSIYKNRDRNHSAKHKNSLK